MEISKQKENYFLSTSIIISALVLAGAWIYTDGLNIKRDKSSDNAQKKITQTVNVIDETITPSTGIALPAQWGNLGKQMIAAGVIDFKKFKEIYAQRGGLSRDMKALIDSNDNGQLIITPQNSGIILNLLWALGLSNKNPILENGPIQDPQYGGAGQFASTAGWTLSQGDAMNHYSAHRFITLTSNQQTLIEKVAKNIYRPCCNNSTYFPDCNHGMAMLGLLELMASQGATEDQMYKAALAVNSYWFPDIYSTIAKYFESKSISWASINPREILNANYSSGQGYAQIKNFIASVPSTQLQNNCGIDAGQTQTVQPQQQGGCDI